MNTLHYTHQTLATLSHTIPNIIGKRFVVVVGRWGVTGDDRIMVDHQHESFWDRMGPTRHTQPRLFQPSLIDLDEHQPPQTLPRACECNWHCSTISKGAEDAIGCDNHGILTMNA